MLVCSAAAVKVNGADHDAMARALVLRQAEELQRIAQLFPR
jgi:hypothetical protein